MSQATDEPSTGPDLAPEQRALMEGLIRGGKSLADGLGVSPRELKHLYGEEKAWHRLVLRREQPDTERLFYGLGNLDTDVDSEFLYWDVGQRQLLFKDLDGTEWRLPDGVRGPDFNLLWDYDGDGIDELIMQQWHAKPDPNELDKLLAFNILGKFVGPIQGNPIGPYVVKGDFDGDGRQDLFLRGGGNYGDFIDGKAYGLNGKVLFTTSVDWINARRRPVPGDIDGDGKDELLRRTQLGDEIVVMGLDEPEHRLALAEPLRPMFCADLNQDGTDEIVDFTGSVFDPAKRAHWRLEAVPTNPVMMLMHTPYEPRIATYRRGTETYLVAILTRNVKTLFGDTLAIWDKTGKLVYAMRFGTPLRSIAVGQHQGGDHLILEGNPGTVIW